jgi:hypothetical protein
MRHQKPDFVIEWERHNPAPRCCHTCENYDANGVCTIHNERPPESFASSVDDCDLWEEVIPF